MNRDTFRTLNKKGKIIIEKRIEQNILPSATDPTQNVPVSAIYNAMNGLGPMVDVRKINHNFNNLHDSDLTSIEKRDMDAFDVFAESRKVKNTLTDSVGKIAKDEKRKLKNIQKNEKNN